MNSIGKRPLDIMGSRYDKVASRDNKDFEIYESVERPGPGLIMLAEMFNANKNIRGVTDSWATRGFVCIAPDLYWRTRPRAYFDYNDEGRQQARELYQALDRELATDDVGCCADYLRKHPSCDGRVFAMGFCLGGELALLSALRRDIDAASIYYGTNMLRHVEKTASALQVRTELHFAERDEHVPISIAEAFQGAAASNPNIEVFVYPGVEHAFARPNRPQYDEAATALANQRTLDLFTRTPALSR